MAHSVPKTLLLAAIALPLAAQAPPPAAAPSAPKRDAGLLPEWDQQKNLGSLSGQVKKIADALMKLQPTNWVAQGAPEAYLAQWKSAQSEAQALIASANTLAQRPDRLTAGLDTYFRLQSMETRLASLIQAAHRYQPGEAANQLDSLAAANAKHRETLRQQLLDLAATKEQELEIIDQEAQRCRSELFKQSGPRPPQRGRDKR